MAVEVPQNKEISGEGKNGGRKGVGSATLWRGANREWGIHIKKRVQGGVIKRDVDPIAVLRV